MTNPLYIELAEDAVELIREFGIPMTLEFHGTPPVYDPIEGEDVPGNSPSTVEVYGVMSSPTESYSKTVPDGSIQLRDMLVYLEPGVRRPLLTDVLIIGSERWNVVNVRIERPADVDLIYTVQVRP